MPDPNLTLVSTADLMQDGISSALAVLAAIEGAELFRELPEDATAAQLHNHGCHLLNLLEDSLRRLQAEVDARHTAAEVSGTCTDALEQEWSDSTVTLCDAEWAVFETAAPDLQAVAWKVRHLVAHGMIQDDHAAILAADLRRLIPEG